MTEQSLKDKTVKGVAWSAVDCLLELWITFIVGSSLIDNLAQINTDY